MIRVAAIGIGPHRADRAQSAYQALATLAAEDWAPPGGSLTITIAPHQWWGARAQVEAAAATADAVVLFAAGWERERIAAPIYAFNRADPRWSDSLGLRWPGRELTPGGAERYRATLPSAALALALASENKLAHAPHQSEADVANACLYWLLAAPDAPPAALVRLPVSMEIARAEGGRAFFNRLEILEAVKTSLSLAATVAVAPAAAARRG